MSFHVTVLRYPEMHCSAFSLFHMLGKYQRVFFLGFFPLSFNKLGHLTGNFGHAGWIFPNKDITVVSWQYQCRTEVPRNWNRGGTKAPGLVSHIQQDLVFNVCSALFSLCVFFRRLVSLYPQTSVS